MRNEEREKPSPITASYRICDNRGDEPEIYRLAVEMSEEILADHKKIDERVHGLMNSFRNAVYGITGREPQATWWRESREKQ